MKNKAIITIMSHLSDAQTLAGIKGQEKMVNIHINFAKFLLLKYKDTDTEIDYDAEYELFEKKHPHLAK